MAFADRDREKLETMSVQKIDYPEHKIKPKSRELVAKPILLQLVNRPIRDINGSDFLGIRE